MYWGESGDRLVGVVFTIHPQDKFHNYRRDRHSDVATTGLMVELEVCV